MTLANSKELACQNFRLDLGRPEFKADKAPQQFLRRRPGLRAGPASRARSGPLIAQPVRYQSARFAGHARPFEIRRNKTRLLSLMSAFRVKCREFTSRAAGPSNEEPDPRGWCGPGFISRHCRVHHQHRRAPLTARNSVFFYPGSHSWGAFHISSGLCRVSLSSYPQRPPKPSSAISRCFLQPRTGLSRTRLRPASFTRFWRFSVRGRRAAARGREADFCADQGPRGFLSELSPGS